MSGAEREGPWVYMTANGGVLIRDQEMSPDYGAVLLVPQTDVDALQANYDDAFNHINEVKDALDLVGDASESIGEGVRKLVAEIGPLKARLIQTEAARDDWRTSYIKSETALTNAQAVPSLPAVDSLEGLRYAADVIECRAKGAAYEGSTEVDEWPFAAHELRADADRLERELVEKAKRDKVRTALAETIEKYGENDDWEWCLGEADAILDRFDITPKDGRA